MIASLTTIALAAMLVCGQAQTSAGEHSAAAGPFARAALAPADVKAFLHIEGAGALRAELGNRPIAHWIEGVFDGGEAARVWAQLADDADIEPDRLLDLCFGSRATLLLRQVDGAGEWAVITEVPQRRAGRLLKRLNAVVRPPRFSLAMLELPEHALLLAHRAGEGRDDASILVIGPKDRPNLFEHVARSLDQQPEHSLAAHAAFEHAANLGPGVAGLFIRHDPPMGGWSVAVANLDGDQLTLRHRAHFDNAPFARSVTSLEIDADVLDGFAREALVAMVEPTDLDGGRFETFFLARFGESLLSPAIRRNLCDRRIVVLGEIEGRQEADPVDIQATTLAICLELKNAHLAECQVDRHMLRLARRLDQRGEGRFKIDVPDRDDFTTGKPRSIDISPATKWLAGSLPLAQPVTLNWIVVDGEEQRWAVIATHPRKLDDSVMALMKRDDARLDATASRGKVHNCGVANGTRIGQHLRSWSDRADLFADERDQAQFRRSLLLMAKLAEGIEQCRWRLARPSANEMCLEVTITLTAPESATGNKR